MKKDEVNREPTKQSPKSHSTTCTNTDAASTTTTSNHQHLHRGRRPADRTTMEGMIWNANDVLEQALDFTRAGGNNSSTLESMFANCIGVVILSIVEGGLFFTGNVGSGILLTKNPTSSTTSGGSTTTTWSNPVACGLVGVGYGFIAGVSLKDVIVFINDEYTPDAMLSEHGLKVGGQAEVTVGTVFGHSMKLDAMIGNQGKVGTTVSLAFSKGLLFGIALEGAVIGLRKECNNKFYGATVTDPNHILDGTVALPSSSLTSNALSVLEEVHKKLDVLTAG